ncbi:MFS transporter [Acetobacteraceae bacterium]|nr:MFS transporter [Acetobacteraceae bacterium]
MTTSPPVPHRSPTLTVMPIVLFNFIVYFVVGLPNAVISAIFVHQALGFSTAVAGFVITTQYLGTFIARLFAGSLVDKYGSKKILSIGLIACTISGIFMALASIWAYSIGSDACLHNDSLRYAILGVALISRLFMGWGESWTATPVTAWNIRRVGHDHISVAISWNGVTTYSGIAIGVGVGQWMASLPPQAAIAPAIGLLPVGLVSMALALIALLILSSYKALPPLHNADKGKPGSSMSLFTAIGKVLPYGLGLAAGSFGFGSINAFLALYYQANTWNHLNIAWYIFAFCFIATRLCGTGPIDKGYGVRIAMGALAVEALAFIIMALFHQQAAAIVGVALTATGFSLIFPALGTEATKMGGPESTGILNAAFSLFTDSTIFIVGPLMGVVKDLFGWYIMFCSVGTLCIVGIIATLGLLAIRKKEGIVPVRK